MLSTSLGCLKMTLEQPMCVRLEVQIVQICLFVNGEVGVLRFAYIKTRPLTLKRGLDFQQKRHRLEHSYFENSGILKCNFN